MTVRIATPALATLLAVGTAGWAGRSLAEMLGAGVVVAVVATLIALAARPNAAPEPAGMPALGATVADLSPDALVLYSDVGRILYANPTARDLFFEGADPSGKNFLRLAAQAPTAISKALLGASDRLVTLDIDGQQETFHLNRRVFDLDGDEVTLLVVRTLTREISRREVETLENVVRVISHEVNNSLAPIASLVGSARLIAERPEHHEKLGSIFDTIEERARHLLDFLAGYANLARLPAPRPRDVPWQSFLEHLAELYPGVQVGAPPAQNGFFDPVQIEQILINLIKNALEAGSPEQAIELRIAGEPDGGVRLELADGGHGFSGEALASAFMPFYTTKRAGSGMGHTLCREIVHAHGGTISVANRPEGGAQATVVLPGPRRPDSRVARSRTRLTLSR